MNLPLFLLLIAAVIACWIIAKRTWMTSKNQSLETQHSNELYSAVDLKSGEDGVVLTVVGDDTLRQRLASMGIMAGTVITSPTSSDFNDPRTYMVRGYQLCMRTSEASNILLQTEESI